MSIVGHGIDLVETARIARMIEEHGQRFLDRVYTPQEQAYCESSPRRRVERYAARFAAKEAVLKVLGTGWRGQIAWTDVEVTREDSGQPGVKLTGECQRLANLKGILRWWLSLSHIEGHAMASAIGETA